MLFSKYPPSIPKVGACKSSPAKDKESFQKAENRGSRNNIGALGLASLCPFALSTKVKYYFSWLKTFYVFPRVCEIGFWFFPDDRHPELSPRSSLNASTPKIKSHFEQIEERGENGSKRE